MSKNKDNNVNSSINCDVSSCDYNNKEEGKCSLANVNITTDVNRDKCSDCSSTLCQSFESSGGVITDNEYEVNSEYEKEEAECC